MRKYKIKDFTHAIVYKSLPFAGGRLLTTKDVKTGIIYGTPEVRVFGNLNLPRGVILFEKGKYISAKDAVEIQQTSHRENANKEMAGSNFSSGVDSFILNDVSASSFAFDMDSTEIQLPSSQFSGDDESNVIGEGVMNLKACGVKPLGIGKKGKAKLAEWEQCVADNEALKKKNKELKIEKKQAKIDSTNADTQATRATANALNNTSAPDNGGMGGGGDAGIPTYVYVIVGGVLLVVIAFFAFKHFKHGALAPTPKVA